MNIEKQVFHEVAPGFYNLRTDYRVMLVLNVETHMSVLKLDNGKVLIVDAAPLDESGISQLHSLTGNGANVEAVVHTHPFHTGSIEQLNQIYPNAPLYGCPRHVANFPQLKWAGTLENEAVRKLWEPEVEIRIPQGCEFVAPKESDHFATAFVFHKKSRTIHVDDTLMYILNPGIFTQMTVGKGLQFHVSAKHGGLNQTREGPLQFLDFLKGIARDWPFEHGAFAHMAVKRDTVKDELLKLIETEEPELLKLSEKWSK
eukprot:TRINITY_DN340_c0_g1_i1.p1 TRINITY_DN340_c0_g1~~TRINITY_DN340_c0_g1_i1.p1  ORF type:complete len:258 (-),score=57.16 TRINITY_DN340_c0_g1_i1:57-830(-)